MDDEAAVAVADVVVAASTAVVTTGGVDSVSDSGVLALVSASSAITVSMMRMGSLATTPPAP